MEKNKFLLGMLLLLSASCGSKDSSNPSNEKPAQRDEVNASIGLDEQAKMIDRFKDDLWVMNFTASRLQMLSAKDAETEEFKSLFQAFNTWKSSSRSNELNQSVDQLEVKIQKTCLRAKPGKGAPVCFRSAEFSDYSRDEDVRAKILSSAYEQIAIQFGASDETAARFRSYMNGLIQDLLKDHDGELAFSKYEELRVGGSVSLEVKDHGVYQVLCVDSLQGWISSQPVENQSLHQNSFILTPGQKIVLQGKEGPVGAHCRDFHPVNCSVVGGTSVFIGSHLETMGDPDARKTLAKLQAAGVCR